MSRTSLTVVLLAATLASSVASAQSTDDDSVFDFSLPGARSRGIGGAFVAIADDATSVYSNPAGLTTLFRPEISFEVRHWDLTSLVIDRGHAYGPATGVGIDTLNGIYDRAAKSQITGLSFLSFAYPRHNWAFGVFYHQLARYQMNRQTRGAFFDCHGGSRGPNATPPYCEQSQDDGVDRLFPAVQAFDLSIRSTGATVTRDFEFGAARRTLSVGVTIQYSHFTLDATRLVYAARGSLKYAPGDFSDDNIENVGRRAGDDWAFSVNAGVIYDLTPKWSVGATFRQGPRFTYEAQTTTGGGNPGTPGVTFVNNPDSPFKVPDTWAVGVAFRPNNAWRFGFEYDRVLFKQLIDQIVNTAHPADDPEGQMVVSRLVQDNADQLRFGGEYSTTAFGGQLLSFRAGFWYDPLHQPYLSLDDPSTGYPAPGWSLLFPKRTGHAHVTAGVGLATQRHFQVDVAVDYSKLVGTYALSAVYRF